MVFLYSSLSPFYPFACSPLLFFSPFRLFPLSFHLSNFIAGSFLSRFPPPFLLESHYFMCTFFCTEQRPFRANSSGLLLCRVWRHEENSEE